MNWIKSGLDQTCVNAHAVEVHQTVSKPGYIPIIWCKTKVCYNEQICCGSKTLWRLQSLWAALPQNTYMDKSVVSTLEIVSHPFMLSDTIHGIANSSKASQHRQVIKTGADQTYMSQEVKSRKWKEKCKFLLRGQIWAQRFSWGMLWCLTLMQINNSISALVLMQN